MIIDTHCHLSEQNLPLVLGHTLVNVSVNLASTIRNHFLFSSISNVVNAAGIHPWFVNDLSEADVVLLIEFVQSSNISVLGEIGLDFSKAHCHSKDTQLIIFEQQLAFAYRYDLPVSIHMVKSYNHTYDLLKKYPVRGVVHGFNGSIEEAVRFVKLGMKLGVNGLVCRANTPRYDRWLEHISLQNIVLETDFPNIRLPQQKVAQLYDIFSIAAALAQFKGVPLDALVAITSQNAKESLL